jgi:hypothetical protein
MPDMELPTLTFRYRGPINWLAVYRGSVDFFRRKNYDVKEKKYVDKVSEFEGEMSAEQMVDIYIKISFELFFKSFDMVPTSEPGVFNGKMQMLIKVKVEEKIPKDLFHNIYKKIMKREIEDDIAGSAIIIQHQYLEFLKKTCNVEAKKHA